MTRGDDNSYKGILRNMSIFGGVQVFQVITGLLRGKIAAIFLGPAGMGVASLFTSSATTLQQLSSLGLGQSIVREVAAADSDGEGETGDSSALSAALRVSRFLLILTGLCGAILTLVLSRWLSVFTFGSEEYAVGFALLSVMVFFTILANGEIAILQGMHRVRRLALATIGALVIGLTAMLPLYWILGDKGIVPAMAVNALATWIFYRWCSSRETVGLRLGPSLFSLSLSRIAPYRPLIFRMVKLGTVLVAAQLIGSLTTYLINIFVRNFGSTEDVGLFQAANSLTMQCVAVVFAAMGMEFFPRLTTVAENPEKIRTIVNRQIEVVALVAAPIASLMILFAPLAVRIVLSEDFLPAVPLIRWMCIGILFKAIAYPPGYISFAKGDRKTFFWLEGIAGNLILLSISVVCFLGWGLNGLGVASTATFFIYIFVYIILTRCLYGFKMSGKGISASLISSLLVGLTFLCSLLNSDVWSVAAMTVCCVVTLLYGGLSLMKLVKNE